MKRIQLILGGLLVAGCTVGPAYQRPSITLPDEIRGASPSLQTAPAAESLADRTWWEIFDDETLEALIDEALHNNHDLRLAAWRVAEARAVAGIAGTESWPQLQASAGWSRGQQPSFVSPVEGTFDLYDAQLGLSWEVDLWGRLRRLDEAAVAQYLATEEARRGVMLSLVSEVARSYFELRALDLQLEIARRTAAAFEETRGLFDDRLEAGLASALETESAVASLATVESVIPDLERRIVAQENTLAFLVGRPAGEIARGAALTDQLLPPEIPVGLPADLLARRPDLRQAEQELVAANAEVGLAVADFYPRFSLTGFFGGLAPDLSDLFDEGRTWSIGGGLLTPIVQGKRLEHQHQAAIARWEQAKVRFEQRVSSALAEVSTALVAYQKLGEVERQQARAVAAYREALEMANTRYLSGLADYFQVLDNQQQLFPAESALTQTRSERLATLVELYRALGGGWQLSDPQWVERGAVQVAAREN